MNDNKFNTKLREAQENKNKTIGDTPFSKCKEILVTKYKGWVEMP